MKYKNLLLALGITISAPPIANAKADSDDSNLERKSICRKFPSPFFLEIRVEPGLEVESLDIGCSVSNSACGGGSGGGGGGGW